MKKQIKPLSILVFLLMFVPWTIFVLRQYEFAMVMPNATIIIGIYCVEILVAFVLTAFVYFRKRVRDILSSIALVVNGMYAVFVIGIVCNSLPTWLE